MNISLELYKAFYYVAKNESISRAANELMISQPAISKSIKTLESQMNVSLFVRKRDGVVLTEVGKVFYEKVKNAMELINSAENDVLSLSNLDTGVLSIGASKTIIHEYLMPIITNFHKDYPNIKLRIYTDNVNKLNNNAKIGLIDVIFTNLPDSNFEDAEIINLLEFHDCLAASNKFNNLKDKKIDIKDLKKLPLLVLSKGFKSRIRLDDFCIEKNITINPEMEFSSDSLIKEFTKSGFGIGMLTEENIKDELVSGELFKLNIDLDLSKKHLGLVYYKDNTRIITKKFIDYVKNYNNTNK